MFCCCFMFRLGCCGVGLVDSGCGLLAPVWRFLAFSRCGVVGFVALNCVFY